MESWCEKMRKFLPLPRWRKKKFSAAITEEDPVLRVTYLGNVLTGWAKGEGCLDKPLATLWKNYCQSNRSDIVMRLSVCNTGLQATTNEHGLTEYWAHRVTWCSAPSAYPKIFAWVYRHEGRRMKQELRCHAVLCTTSRQAKQLASSLEQRLREALHDYRREKLARQAARLGVASCLYDDYINAIPRRKLLLTSGIAYRSPLERSKSAPKLGTIDEAPGQEEAEERDWLKALESQRARTSPSAGSSHAPSSSAFRTVSTLDTVFEEEDPPAVLLSSKTSLSAAVPEANPDAVSPDGLQDLGEIEVTLSPDGSCASLDQIASCDVRPMTPLLLPNWRREKEESEKSPRLFASADCLVEDGLVSPSQSPPLLPRSNRRSLPCRVAHVDDYVRMSGRKPAENSADCLKQAHDRFLEELNFRLRLDSAVELLETDSFGDSPMSTADHSPNLAELGRLALDTDNVSDESGYSEDKDLPLGVANKTAFTTRITINEEFTLSL